MNTSRTNDSSDSTNLSPTQRRRANTTSTMFICSTLETPNRDQIIKCVAKSIYCALSIHASQKPTVNIEIFDERKHPLSAQRRNYNRLPVLEEIVHFVRFLFLKQALSPQVGIMAIHYVDQLIHKTGLLITPVNWRRVLLCALLVADKVWEEDVVCNADYCNESFPFLTVEDLNMLERIFLTVLDFKLVLQTSVYASYYFALRSISDPESFPSRPLDKETASQLLHKSYSPIVPKRRRSRSMEMKPDTSKLEEKCALSYEQFSIRLVDVTSN